MSVDINPDGTIVNPWGMGQDAPDAQSETFNFDNLSFLAI
jgi:hypothetical protein